jgi:hypothetical protein
MKATYDQFVQWKHHTVTQALVEEIERTISEIAGEVLTRKTPNPDRDQYLRGFLAGIVMARDFQPEFTKVEEHGEVDINDDEA